VKRWPPIDPSWPRVGASAEEHDFVEPDDGPEDEEEDEDPDA
jgi:hypothetical protein